MITKDNFKKVLDTLGFRNENNIYIKHYDNVDCELKADFTNQKLIYPTEKGFEVNDGTTSNFSHPENFVVFECVCRLLEKGYRPEHIELEPRWSLGHGGKSGKADICVKNKDGSPYLCIIECKTAGSEYRNELQNMLNSDEKHSDGGQLFSYWQQERSTKWLCLYASDFEDEKLTHSFSYVSCSDDSNVVELAKDDSSILLYKDSGNAKELFAVWKETYKQKIINETDIIFDEETVAYDIGVLPLKKKRLVDFSRDDKIVNQFEEILRHNNVSDKENAFNRLIALFIAKLYDEKTKTLESEVEFQYKTGTDTYQKMQDRLQKLHHFGMKEFMKEDVFYVADDYVKNVMKNAIGENREQLEAELNETITKLKFYTNNDFAFKDVHNKALFYQNGKILVEMVELFQKYRIIDSNELQLLGDMFEQLLNKGFKQNEGQFFTPIPITCFIWKCLPLESIIKDEEKKEIRYPKVIDYACGAGHFLTEGFREINEKIVELGLNAEKDWERDCIFGIEKDYRLARVSKISMFMHGADNGNIVFGDGLDNHNEKIVIENGQFDILVANPPYSVSAFKNHLELKNNELKLLDYISKDGKEIETLFVERIAQLLKPKGIAAVILPSSILSNSSTSYIKAREEILKNFAVHAIVQFGSKTFGATGTNTVVLYLQKNNEPPIKSEIVKDNVTAIFENEDLKVVSDKEIFDYYCNKISVSKEDYLSFIKASRNNEDYKQHKTHAYFGMYVKEFEASADFKKLKEEKLNKAFYDYALNIEKEKLYYFALVYKQNTLVVTAPSDNAEQENFLGYSWSNRKGDEGIKIKSSSPQNSCGLLYNVYDEEHSIARYVKDAFLGIYRNDKYISANALKDMIDFSRTTFDKAIKPNVQSVSVQIESKFPLVKLGDCYKISSGGTPSRKNPSFWNTGTIPWLTTGELQNRIITDTNEKITGEGLKNSSAKIYPKDSIVIAMYGMTVGFSAKLGIESTTNQACAVLYEKKIDVETDFVWNYIKSQSEQLKALRHGSSQPNLNADDVANFPIPLPPLDVQKSIVAECEAVDSEYHNAQKEIDDSKTEIAEIMASVCGEEKRLSEICSVINPSKSDIRDISDDTIVSFVDMLSVSNDGFIEKKTDKPLSELRKGSYTYFAENDIIIAKITPCMENGKCAIARNLTNKIGMGSSEFHVFRIKYDYSTEFVFYYLNRAEIRNEAQKNMTGASGHRRVPISFYEKLIIPVPPLAEQQKIVAQISALEEKITAAKRVMAECPQKKQAILDKWLR